MKKLIFTFFTSFLVLCFFSITSVSYATDSKSAVFATGKKTFVFDQRQSKWTVYGANGQLIRSGRAAGGKRHCADVHRPCMTPIGTFRIYAKEGPHFVSSKYPLPHGGASMP